MNIYEIKEKTKETSPYFFTRSSMRFFGQRLQDFSVKKQLDGRYLITAPRKGFDGKYLGKTIRYYNPVNNKLEHN